MSPYRSSEYPYSPEPDPFSRPYPPDESEYRLCLFQRLGSDDEPFSVIRTSYEGIDVRMEVVASSRDLEAIHAAYRLLRGHP